MIRMPKHLQSTRRAMRAFAHCAVEHNAGRRRWHVDRTDRVRRKSCLCEVVCSFRSSPPPAWLAAADVATRSRARARQRLRTIRSQCRRLRPIRRNPTNHRRRIRRHSRRRRDRTPDRIRTRTIRSRRGATRGAGATPVVEAAREVAARRAMRVCPHATPVAGHRPTRASALRRGSRCALRRHRECARRGPRRGSATAHPRRYR